MRIAVARMFLGLLFLAAGISAVLNIVDARKAHAQEKPVAEYKLTELQATKLQLARQVLITAEVVLQSAQKDVNSANAAYHAQAAEVKKENGWPEETTFDDQTATFAAPRQAPKAMPPPK